MIPEKPKHKFFTLNLILRLTLFAAMFIVIFTFALTSISGFKIDFKNADLNPSSIIQVSTVPAGSSVSINNQSLSFFSNNRASVVNGNYQINVSRNEFYDWQTVLPIRARTIWWVDARLVPKVKRVATVKTYKTLLASYASPDRKWLLNHLSLNMYELVDLRSDKPVYYVVDMESLLPASLDQQELVFYDWNLANDTMFFRDKISNKTYLFGIGSRNHLVNLSTNYPTLSFDQIKIAGDGGKTLYVMSGQDLYRINLDKLGSISKVASGVVDYRIINRNQVALTQSLPTGSGYKLSASIYDYMKDRLFEFERITESDMPVFLEAFESRYDGRSYVAFYSDHRFKIWRIDSLDINPPSEESTNFEEASYSTDNSATLQRFKSANPGFREYFSIYLENNPKNIFVGGDGRFVLVDEGEKTLSMEDGNKLTNDLILIKDLKMSSLNIDRPLVVNQVLVFDTNYKMKYALQLALGAGSTSLSEAKTSPVWLSEGVLWENIIGMVRIKDFSGQNQHKLIPADNRYDIQLSANEKYVYFYQIINNLPVLRRLQMTDF